MKNRFTLLSVVGLLAFTCNQLFAQMVGDCVFLQGRYVEIGIAPNGGYGAPLVVPTGYHTNLTSFTFYDPGAGTTTTSTNFLGFVADYGRDGWTVGAPPFFGDFYMPGTPQEGWAVEIDGDESRAYIPAYLATGTTGYATSGAGLPLTGTSTSYSNVGGVMKGVWNGNKGALAIRQTTVLDTNKLYFTVNVVMTNTGSSTLNNIYYLRTLDPDNDVMQTGGSFNTHNEITFQLPSAENKVLVAATGTLFTNAYVGLGTKDCRAKCMIFTTGLTPGPTDTLHRLFHETTGSHHYTAGFTNTADVGVGLVYNIGSIPPGDSTSLTYAYILNAAYIDSALDATRPRFYVNDTLADTTYRVNLCGYAPDSVGVRVTNGGFYTWRFNPDSFVTVTGSSFVVHTDSISANINYTITGTNTAGGCDSVKFVLNLDHGNYPGPVVTPVSYCQYATPVPLTAPGTGITWWTSATGGVGSSTPPTPPTSVPGTITYYVSQRVGLCESNRSPFVVNIIPLPLPPTLTGITPYCFGQAFVPFGTVGSGILWYTAPTGGVGSIVAPAVNTSLAGTQTFYASQTVSGCEGPRQSITTTVLDPITASFSHEVRLGCTADTVILNNSSVNAVRYVWEFGDGYSDTVASPIHVYRLQGNYRIRLLAVNYSCVDSEIVNVSMVHPLKAGFSYDPMVLCQGKQVTFTDTSIGSAGTRYRWDFGNGANSTDANPVYSFNNTGTYLVRQIITDFVPCSDTATALVYVDTISGISLAVTDTVICKGANFNFMSHYASIGNTGIDWDFGDGMTFKDMNPVNHAFQQAGTYTVTVTAKYRACPDTTVSRVLTIKEQPNVNLGDDKTICPGSEPIVLEDLVKVPAQVRWKWNTGQETKTIKVTEPGYYYVTADLDGCTTSDSIWILRDCYMDIPNVFSPNGDGVNDYFFPRQFLTRGLTKFAMQIYNRWGQVVFESNSVEGRGWDGTINGQPQPQGVFVYVMDATFRDGKKEHRQGNVTLVR